MRAFSCLFSLFLCFSVLLSFPAFAHCGMDFCEVVVADLRKNLDGRISKLSKRLKLTKDQESQINVLSKRYLTDLVVDHKALASVKFEIDKLKNNLDYDPKLRDELERLVPIKVAIMIGKLKWRKELVSVLDIDQREQYFSFVSKSKKNKKNKGKEKYVWGISSKMMNKYAKKLKFTDQQKMEMDNIFSKYESVYASYNQEVESMENSLKELVSQVNVDFSKVQFLMERMGMIKVGLKLEKEKEKRDLLNILTEDQREKFEMTWMKKREGKNKKKIKKHKKHAHYNIYSGIV